MCYIIDSNHGIKTGALIREQPIEIAMGGIEIGNDVWIGAACRILKEAKIGKGAEIGVNSFVNYKISPNVIAFATSGKVYSFRK